MDYSMSKRKTSQRSAKSAPPSKNFTTNYEIRNKSGKRSRITNKNYKPTRTGDIGKNDKSKRVKQLWFNAVDHSGQLFNEHQMLMYDPTLDIWVSDDGFTVIHNSDLVENKAFSYRVFGVYYFVTKNTSFLDSWLNGFITTHKINYEMIPEGLRMQFSAQETFKQKRHAREK